MPENLNRREFVRALGITGAGIALAAASAVTSPSKVLAATDGDSKPGVMPQRYWWVKNVDKPTTEVDWKVMKWYNEWETTRGSLAKYRGRCTVRNSIKRWRISQKITCLAGKRKRNRATLPRIWRSVPRLALEGRTSSSWVPRMLLLQKIAACRSIQAPLKKPHG